MIRRRLGWFILGGLGFISTLPVEVQVVLWTNIAIGCFALALWMALKDYYGEE